MEEIVALDSEKQKKFVKSIKGIKKLIESGKVEKLDSETTVSDIIKAKSKSKAKLKAKRGLVYLSHIPHGFYESEMTDYFKQFGGVTNARVIRSSKTGKSKGFAFVEFANTNVAQIVAETMNNYLMGKRLLKASYIPPEKQKKAFRKNWNAIDNPGATFRRQMKKAHNEDKTDEEDLARARKILKNLTKTKNKLSEMGIDYSFFNPVDVPQELLVNTEIKEEKNDQKNKKNPKLQMKTENTEENSTKIKAKINLKRQVKEENKEVNPNKVKVEKHQKLQTKSENKERNPKKVKVEKKQKPPTKTENQVEVKKNLKFQMKSKNKDGSLIKLKAKKNLQKKNK